MKLTKKETIKKIRDIISGASGHTHMLVTPLKGGYDVQTGIGKFAKDYDEYHNPLNLTYEHCCNDCTLKEAKEIFENDLELM
jgi:hypothetical protein